MLSSVESVEKSESRRIITGLGRWLFFLAVCVWGGAVKVLTSEAHGSGSVAEIGAPESVGDLCQRAR